MHSKMTLSPGTGAQFGLSAGGVQSRVRGNPIPYLLPWATALLLLGLATGIRFALATDTAYAWFWSTATAGLFVGLTYLAWKASRPRGRMTCGLATCGVGASGVWSWYVAGMAHVSWRPYAVYAIATVLVCVGANFYVAFRGHGGEDGGSNVLAAIGGAVAKLRNVNEVRIQDGQVIARYEMQPGTPASDLQTASATQALASLHQIPPDGVRVLPDPDNAAVGEMRLSVTNPLRSSPPWPGPSLPHGGTIMDPIVVGMRRGGSPLQFWLPGDEALDRNASHLQVTGMPGAGKSWFIRYVLVELLSRGMPDEVEYWYGNSRKPRQEPSWVLKGAGRTACDRKALAAMLRDLRDEAPARSAQLGDRGHDQWVPGCGVPFRLVVLDEFADIATDVERLITDLAETLRSLGVVLLPGLQRASASRWPTDARSSMGSFACFGVKDDTDAAMALPEEILDAGAQPWVWGNKKPGMCYLTAPGVPEDQWSEEGRTFKTSREELARWAEYYIARRNGQTPTPPAPLPRPTPPAPTRASDDVDVEEDDREPEEVIDIDDLDEEELVGEADDVLQEVADNLGGLDDLEDLDEEVPRRPVVPLDCRDALDADHRAPIEVTGGGMRLALSPKMPPQQARLYVRQYLADMHSRGFGPFKKEEVGDILAAVGYGASWLDKVLGEFCRETPLWLRRTDERGWYDIVAPPLQAIEGDAP